MKENMFMHGRFVPLVLKKETTVKIQSQKREELLEAPKSIFPRQNLHVFEDAYHEVQLTYHPMENRG